MSLDVKICGRFLLYMALKKVEKEPGSFFTKLIQMVVYTKIPSFICCAILDRILKRIEAKNFPK